MGSTSDDRCDLVIFVIWKSDPNCPGRHSPNNLLLLICLKLLLLTNFVVIMAFTDRLEKQGCCGPLALLIRQPKTALYLPYFSQWPYICLIFSSGHSINFPYLILWPMALFLESKYMHIRSFPRQILGMYA